MGQAKARVEGPKRWAELHRRAASGVIADDELAFIRSLAKGIGICACKTKWRALLRKMPPDLSSPEAYFAWTVAAHNVVNERLGKPAVLLEDARTLHGSSTTYS